MIELTERRQRLLKYLIESYVHSATPVSSDALARQYAPAVSSATIRNELAYLEELELVQHPHPSAGRIPTELGYRYFVEHLMDSPDPPPGEQRTIRHQLQQVESQIDRWALVTASLLAGSVRAASVVTLPLAPRARVRSLELLSVQDRLGLLVLIMHSGMVRQQLVQWEEALSRDELMQLSNGLSVECADKTAEELFTLGENAEGLEADLLLAAARLLQQTERQLFESLYLEGLSHVLDQPEFAQSQTLRPFIEMLERTPVLGTFLVQASAPDAVRIIIGSEHTLELMHSTSTVLARYGTRAGPFGVLAIVGPTRLPYGRAVSMVRFMSGLLNALIARSADHAPSVRSQERE